jgi:uncharacterized membrane protein YhhN
VTGTAFLLLALAAAVAVADWIAVERANKALEYLAKPATLALLVAAALALDPADGAVRSWFVVALVFCLAGDILLMVPRDLFVFGLGAFLVGHVAYIVGMQVDGVRWSLAGIGLVVVALAAATVGTAVLRAVQRGDEPELFGPVAVYMVVISAMVVSAFGAGHPVGIVGAVLFFSSDALIAWNRFIKESPRGRLAIITTYHLAQFGLLLSLT